MVTDEKIAEFAAYLDDMGEELLDWVHTYEVRSGVGRMLSDAGALDDVWDDFRPGSGERASSPPILAMRINDEVVHIKTILEDQVDDLDLDEMSRYAAMVCTAATAQVLAEHWEPEQVKEYIDELVDAICGEDSSFRSREIAVLDEARMRRSLAKLAAGRADNANWAIDCCKNVGAERAVEVLEELLAGTGSTEFICKYAFSFASQSSNPAQFVILSAYGAQMVSEIYSYLLLVVLTGRTT